MISIDLNKVEWEAGPDVPGWYLVRAPYQADAYLFVRVINFEPGYTMTNLGPLSMLGLDETQWAFVDMWHEPPSPEPTRADPAAMAFAGVDWSKAIATNPKIHVLDSMTGIKEPTVPEMLGAVPNLKEGDTVSVRVQVKRDPDWVMVQNCSFGDKLILSPGEFIPLGMYAFRTINPHVLSFAGPDWVVAVAWDLDRAAVALSEKIGRAKFLIPLQDLEVWVYGKWEPVKPRANRYQYNQAGVRAGTIALDNVMAQRQIQRLMGGPVEYNHVERVHE